MRSRSGKRQATGDDVRQEEEEEVPAKINHSQVTLLVVIIGWSRRENKKKVSLLNALLDDSNRIYTYR